MAGLSLGLSLGLSPSSLLTDGEEGGGGDVLTLNGVVLQLNGQDLTLGA